MKKNISEYICLIDDEYQVIKSLVRELKEYAEENKITIKIYPSPDECMQELAFIAEETSVIISDLRMPGMNGSDFFLSVNEKFPDIELILLTAYNDIDDIQKAIKAKIRSLILKPWNEENLINEIDKARSIYHLKQDKNRIEKMLDKQLEVAGEFQQRLLDTRIPEIDNAKIELTYIPYKPMKMGGDYYDVIKLDDSRFIVNIGDVVGHGVKPAFVTAMLKVLTMSINRRTRSDIFTPGRLLGLLNTQLCTVLENSAEVLVTFSSLLIDTGKKTLTMANAGHMPIFIVNNESCRPYSMEGPALGFGTDISYKEIEIPLNEGDIVVMYTDGLLESEKEHSRIPEAAVERFLVDAGKSSSFNETVIRESRIIRDIDHFYDDVALISVRI